MGRSHDFSDWSWLVFQSSGTLTSLQRCWGNFLLRLQKGLPRRLEICLGGLFFQNLAWRCRFYIFSLLSFVQNLPWQVVMMKRRLAFSKLMEYHYSHHSCACEFSRVYLFHDTERFFILEIVCCLFSQFSCDWVQNAYIICFFLWITASVFFSTWESFLQRKSRSVDVSCIQNLIQIWILTCFQRQPNQKRNKLEEISINLGEICRVGNLFFQKRW